MKNIGTLLFLILFYVVVSGQSYCPCDTKVNHSYPKQKGNFRTIKDYSLKASLFKTEKSELLLYDNVYYSSELDSTKLSADTLLNQLFKNGLLTSDIILKEYINTRKYLYTKEDDSHSRSYVGNIYNDTSNIVEVENIERKKVEKKYPKNMTLFQIAIVFRKASSNSNRIPQLLTQSISDFDLWLNSDIPFDGKNLKEYLKNARILCLEWIGFEI